MSEYESDSTTRGRNWADEDTTPTTDQELRGWYSYGIAAEVFAIVGVGSFLPVTLEQLARENGVLYSDRNTPCIQPTSSQKLSVRANSTRDPDQCIIHLLSSEVTTASFAMYTFSLAVFCQALTLITFSSFADYGDYRKRMLVIFACTGAFSSMAWMFIIPSIYLVGPFLAIIGVVCLGCSFVVLNSFLPLLAANHPSVKAGTKSYNLETDPDSKSLQLSLSNRISAKGMGLGYAGGFFVQILSAILLFTMDKLAVSSSTTLPLRLVLLLAGTWWLVFTIPTARWLRKRPGPPLPTISTHTSTPRLLLAHVFFAWRSLWNTIKLALRLRQAVVFLVAWFLLSDAVATVSGTAILFARTELKFNTVQVALLSLLVSISGLVGAMFWPAITRRFNWRTNRTIVACLLLMELVPMYGLLGYLPFIQAWGVGGIQQQWEMFPLGFVFGVVMGGLSSYCRSFFGLLIPPGHEVAFFALFAITDKGSSAIGPAIVGRIVDVTGQIRPAFVFLAVIIALPVPLIWHVDAESGQADARRMADQLKGGPGTEMFRQSEEEGERLMRGQD